jgi:hypothetical protein
MVLTEDDVLRLETALERAFESCSTDTNALAEFCNDGKTFQTSKLKHMGQFGKTESTKHINGKRDEYQVVKANKKLWLVWGDDPEANGKTWVLPIWRYM